MERRTIVTLPNAISFSRLFLALGFVIFDGTWQRTWLILAAGATDFLDGWAARHGNSSTVAGALIDPIADRVFVLTAVSAFLVGGLLSTLQYFIFLSRDIMTAVGFVVARFIPGLTAAAFRARMLGKTVTTLQLATLIAVLQFPQFTVPLIALVGTLSAVSIVDYTLALSRARARARRASS